MVGTKLDCALFQRTFKGFIVEILSVMFLENEN